MTRKVLLVLGILTLATPAMAKTRSSREVVKRGEYLVATMGCNDCHTPMKFDPELNMPVPDFSRMLSGHPEGAPDPQAAPAGHDMAVIGPTFTSFRLPFGVVYARNLTPDFSSGIGSWTPEMFIKAMRTGKHMGEGRPILPPMPWATVRNATDADLRAIFAYLQSVPAIKNIVPDPKVPSPVYEGLAKAYEKITAAR